MEPRFSLRIATALEVAIARDIDDDACTAFDDVLEGVLALDPAHPYAQAELAQWTASARAGSLVFACDDDGAPIAFASLGRIDGAPHLEQLSVRRAHARVGIGRRLLAHAIAWSREAGCLWITTYAHIPWNRPWYERVGFRPVPADECGPEMRATLRAEKAALPAPEERVAMRYVHAKE